ncbi:MAG TPA: ComF family protein [Vicinamibacterales bacterium]|nr:ComF family protein [Vicinamibacterales bacterium]
MADAAPPAHSRAVRAARRVGDGLLAVLLAPACACCARLLDAPSAGPVCPACWAAIHLITPPVCDACGDPLPSWRAISRGAARCPRCRRTPRAVDRGRAIGEYAGALRQIVHALKYDGRRSVSRPLSAMMRAQGHAVLEGADCVVPVPLHPRRRRQRGFNQAADLAAGLGLPVWPVLRRVRATPSQVDLPAAQRHRNVRNAFQIAAPSRFRIRHADAREISLDGLCVVLVDDVSTTGATLEACARALKAAGVREVRALTAARVVCRRP